MDLRCHLLKQVSPARSQGYFRPAFSEGKRSSPADSAGCSCYDGYFVLKCSVSHHYPIHAWLDRKK